MRVSTNLNSMTAMKYVKQHTEELGLEDKKLSSGDRIVQSSIDPAGIGHFRNYACQNSQSAPGPSLHYGGEFL